jgi:GT2 family glycosyltransferase
VVDNASTDDTALREVAQATGVTIVRNAQNTGFAAGCNSGAAAGTGDVLMLLNPDAEIIAGTVADLEVAFNDSKAMVIGPRLENQEIPSIRSAPRGADLVADLLRLSSFRQRLHWRAAPPAMRAASPGKDWLVGAALVVRRTDWERLGGLDPGFFLWYEDVDFGARVARAGGAIALTEKVRVRHLGASTWTRLPRRRRQWLRVRGAWRYARRHLGWPAAASIAAAAPPALALGAALDVAHWLMRRP